MYCTHCGTLNEDRARYCKKCGTPLESPPKEEKTYSPDNRIQENTAAESPGRKWLLLAAGILGILLLIVPVYLFLSGRQRSGSLEFSQQYQNRIPTATSTRPLFWTRSKARSLWPTTTDSPFMKICSVPAPCWRIRKSCGPW